MAHPTPAAAHHAEAPHVEHITSWAPLIIAIATPFFFLGMIYPMVALPIGLVVMGIGLGWWIREDIKRFRKLPAVGHHGPGMQGPVLGMALFIGTEVLIFASLFAIWFVGAAQSKAPWGEGVHLPILATFINTLVLVASGGTLHWGYLRLKKHNDVRGFQIGLVLTLLLGAAFLVQQVREYFQLIHEGVTIKGDSHGLFGSIFYMLTGTHGAHVAGGLFFLLIVLFRSMRKTQSKEHHVALETAAIYWHFVDVVWILLFIVVYLRWI